MTAGAGLHLEACLSGGEDEGTDVARGEGVCHGDGSDGDVEVVGLSVVEGVEGGGGEGD